MRTRRPAPRSGTRPAPPPWVRWPRRGGDPYYDEQGESGEGERVQDVQHRQPSASAQHDERDRGGCGAQSPSKVDGSVAPGECRLADRARCRLGQHRVQGRGQHCEGGGVGEHRRAAQQRTGGGGHPHRTHRGHGQGRHDDRLRPDPVAQGAPEGGTGQRHEGPHDKQQADEADRGVTHVVQIDQQKRDGGTRPDTGQQFPTHYDPRRRGKTTRLSPLGGGPAPGAGTITITDRFGCRHGRAPYRPHAPSPAAAVWRTSGQAPGWALSNR